MTLNDLLCRHLFNNRGLEVIIIIILEHRNDIRGKQPVRALPTEGQPRAGFPPPGPPSLQEEPGVAQKAEQSPLGVTGKHAPDSASLIMHSSNNTQRMRDVHGGPVCGSGSPAGGLNLLCVWRKQRGPGAVAQLC